MSRFEIYSVCLDPVLGAEMRKTRPCLIISPNEINERLQTVIIAPLTSSYRDLPTRIGIEANGVSGLNAYSYLALDQIKTVDKKRLGNSIGRISDKEAWQVCNVLADLFAF